MTDTDGRLLAVQVHGANIQDRDGGKGMLKRSRKGYPFVQRPYADGGDAGRLVTWAKDKTHSRIGGFFLGIGSDSRRSDRHAMNHAKHAEEILLKYAQACRLTNQSLLDE